MAGAIESLESVAQELNVKVHFLVNAAPENVTYLLVEADSPSALARLAVSFPIVQDFKVTPVMREQELAAMSRQMDAS